MRLPMPLSMALFMLMLAGTTQAQSVPTYRLNKPSARSAQGFTDLVGAHELRDGRVLAVDLRERRIVIADFAKNFVQDVAREGNGPKEFTGTFSLVPWLGDTLLVYGRRDLLKISPSGTAVERYSTVDLTPRPGGLYPPRFADRAGRLYFEGSAPLPTKADGSFDAPIRGTLLRWNPATRQCDTVGNVLYRDVRQPLFKYFRPFPARDAVAVFPDGAIAFVRAQNYHVEIWRDGAAMQSGPVVTHPKLPVEAAERNAYRDDMVRRPRGGASIQGPPGKITNEADRSLARQSVGLPDDAFPPFQPPFVEERATLMDPNGMLWVARSWRAADTDRWYDVFDEGGNLRRRVVLGDRGRVIGFGRNVILIAHPDDDDVEWMERFAVPWSGSQ